MTVPLAPVTFALDLVVASDNVDRVSESGGARRRHAGEPGGGTVAGRGSVRRSPTGSSGAVRIVTPSSVPGESWGSWPAELDRRWRVEIGAGQSSPGRRGQLRVPVQPRERQRGRARARPAKRPTAVARGLPGTLRRLPRRCLVRQRPKVHAGRLRRTALHPRDQRDPFRLRRCQRAAPLAKGLRGTVPRRRRRRSARRCPHSSPRGCWSCTPAGHDGGALIAFDPATGDEKWSLAGDGPSYSSPILTSSSARSNS